VLISAKNIVGASSSGGKEDAIHVMVLTQVAQVSIQFLDSLLMGLDTFAFQPLVELYVSNC
jgi:hypothetical protein